MRRHEQDAVKCEKGLLLRSVCWAGRVKGTHATSNTQPKMSPSLGSAANVECSRYGEGRYGANPCYLSMSTLVPL